MLDFLGGGWGWKNLGDVGSVVCMLPKLRSRQNIKDHDER